MATARMPDEFYELVSHHLPPEKPVGPKGGCPMKPNRVVMDVIWYVLATGCRYEDVPPQMGCSGRTAQRRLRLWEELERVTGDKRDHRTVTPFSHESVPRGID